MPQVESGIPRRLRRAGRARRRGFSYVEITIVVLILGIVSAIAAPRYRDMRQRYAADAAARRVSMDLAMARSHARMKGDSQTVSFGPQGRNYTLPGVPDRRRGMQDYRADLQGLYGAQIEVADFGGDRLVVFNRFGIPDSGGVVTVRAGAAAKSVTLLKSGLVTEP